VAWGAALCGDGILGRLEKVGEPREECGVGWLRGIHGRNSVLRYSPVLRAVPVGQAPFLRNLTGILAFGRRTLNLDAESHIASALGEPWPDRYPLCCWSCS